MLYVHLLLFGFIYPSERSIIPVWLMERLSERVAAEVKAAELHAADSQVTAPHANGRQDANRARPHTNGFAGKLCQGTFVSATQYLRDVDLEGFRDARLKPDGPISHEDLVKWTANFVKP